MHGRKVNQVRKRVQQINEEGKEKEEKRGKAERSDEKNEVGGNPVNQSKKKGKSVQQPDGGQGCVRKSSEKKANQSAKKRSKSAKWGTLRGRSQGVWCVP